MSHASSDPRGPLGSAASQLIDRDLAEAVLALVAVGWVVVDMLAEANCMVDGILNGCPGSNH